MPKVGVTFISFPCSSWASGREKNNGRKNGFFFVVKTRERERERERVQFAKGKAGSSDCSVGVGGFLHNPAGMPAAHFCCFLFAKDRKGGGIRKFESSIRSMGKAESVKWVQSESRKKSLARFSLSLTPAASSTLLRFAWALHNQQQHPAVLHCTLYVFFLLALLSFLILLWMRRRRSIW